uniref:FRIGIDA-like protein n=1 Tax=Phaseolus vulgaris TaxID=3885 RepID=T2DLG6_PHAVU|nr:hydroxyproline-rich glycoprotein [Phaseolus vulgaris]
MGSIPDPGELSELTQPSFDEFQRQTSLMTSCTLLWKELSDHFSSLEEDLKHKSEALKGKMRTLDTATSDSLRLLDRRETSLDATLQIALRTLDTRRTAALSSFLDDHADDGGGEVDDATGLVLKLKSFCLRMDAFGFWTFLTPRRRSSTDYAPRSPSPSKKASIRPIRPGSHLRNLSGRQEKGQTRPRPKLGLRPCPESSDPVVSNPVIGKSRLLVPPTVKEQAKVIPESWKTSLEERGGVENVKTPDVHTFLQHVVTFGIVKNECSESFKGSLSVYTWVKQILIAFLILLIYQMCCFFDELDRKKKGQEMVKALYEVGCVVLFFRVILLKRWVKYINDLFVFFRVDPNLAGRAAYLAARKEQSALRAVIKCIEEYKLEADFPPENLKKRLEQLEKVKTVKTEKRKPVAVPANKRTRASNSNGGPMPPAKAGRLTNAYVSSFPAAPTFVRSPSHGQYPAALPPIPSPPHMYGSRSPPANPYAAYSPEPAPAIAGSYPAAPMNYPAYGGYGNVLAPTYQQAYYR